MFDFCSNGSKARTGYWKWQDRSNRKTPRTQMHTHWRGGHRFANRARGARFAESAESDLERNFCDRERWSFEIWQAHCQSIRRQDTKLSAVLPAEYGIK